MELALHHNYIDRRRRSGGVRRQKSDRTKRRTRHDVSCVCRCVSPPVMASFGLDFGLGFPEVAPAAIVMSATKCREGNRRYIIPLTLLTKPPKAQRAKTFAFFLRVCTHRHTLGSPGSDFLSS